MDAAKLFFLALFAALSFAALMHFRPSQGFSYSGAGAAVPSSSGVAGVGAPPRLVISPGSEQEILSFLQSANSSLDVMLYQFSYAPFKAALVETAKRGVRVRLILEPKIDSNLATASFLSQNGVEVRWGSQDFSSTHAKALSADGKCVLVGSINWSRHAVQENREIAIIDCSPTAAEFEKIFEKDWAKATLVS